MYLLLLKPTSVVAISFFLPRESASREKNFFDFLNHHDLYSHLSSHPSDRLFINVSSASYDISTFPTPIHSFQPHDPTNVKMSYGGGGYGGGSRGANGYGPSYNIRDNYSSGYNQGYENLRF